jgi:hypothetical protein
MGLAFTLQHLAALAALRGHSSERIIEECHRAASILGYVDARLAALEAMREYTEKQEYDAMIPVLHGSPGIDGWRS